MITISSSLIIKPYNRELAIDYAHRWSYDRNPNYLDFSELGGDCTNFISQCIYAGSNIMNYTPIYGWYYINSYNRSAAWSGVPFLYKFLITNKGLGPFGQSVSMEKISPADIIQLADENGIFYHSLFIVEVGTPITPETILVATHSFDSDYRALSTYEFVTSRFIHIEGVHFST